MTRLPSTSIMAALSLTFVSIAHPVAAQETPKVEISGGYQLLHLWGEGGGSETLSKGWYGDISGNVTPLFGIVFQASGNYKTVQETISNAGFVISGTGHLRIHQYLGGVRFNARPNKTVTPFAQVLVGTFHTSGSAESTVTAGGESTTMSGDLESSNHFALQAGGGANIMISKAFGVRGGGDYVRVFEKDGGVNAFRASVGAVFAF